MAKPAANHMSSARKLDMTAAFALLVEASSSSPSSLNDCLIGGMRTHAHVHARTRTRTHTYTHTHVHARTCARTHPCTVGCTTAHSQARRTHAHTQARTHVGDRYFFCSANERELEGQMVRGLSAVGNATAVPAASIAVLVVVLPSGPHTIPVIKRILPYAWHPDKPRAFMLSSSHTCVDVGLWGKYTRLTITMPMQSWHSLTRPLSVPSCSLATAAATTAHLCACMQTCMRALKRVMPYMQCALRHASPQHATTPNDSATQMHHSKMPCNDAAQQQH